jgi:hypothetical protein
VLAGSQKVRFVLAPRQLRNFGQNTWRSYAPQPGVRGQCPKVASSTSTGNPCRVTMSRDDGTSLEV